MSLVSDGVVRRLHRGRMAGEPEDQYGKREQRGLNAHVDFSFRRAHCGTNRPYNPAGPHAGQGRAACRIAGTSSETRRVHGRHLREQSPLADALAQVGAQPGKRREVSIAGRRVKTVDVHAHCFVPDVWDLVKNTPLADTAKANLTGTIALGNPQRLIDMDAQGIDYQAINVNAWGYSADRALATRSGRAAEPEDLGVVRRASRSLRGDGHAGVAASRPRGRAARTGGEQAGPARRGHRRQRRRAGALGSQVRSVLGEGGGARRAAVHASAARTGHHAEPTTAGKRRAWATRSAIRSRRRCSCRT